MPTSPEQLRAAPAAPCATVVLVRAGADAPELYMVKRHAGITFGESYTFPGGVLDGSDREAHAHSAGRSAAEADRLLGLAGSDEAGLDYLSAAIRELFEETGVLLARDRRRRWGGPDREAREALNQGTLGWAEFLRARGLRMACEALHYIAWWVTPVVRPRRFSARFFVAALPPGQEAMHDGAELTAGQWVRAADALAAGRGGDIQLPLPTRRTLSNLAAFDTLDTLIEWARTRAASGIEPTRPVLVEVDGRQRFLLPGDPGYPVDVGA